MKTTKLFLNRFLVISMLPMFILFGCVRPAGKSARNGLVTTPIRPNDLAQRPVKIRGRAINDIKFSPDGKRLAIASSKGLVIHDTSTNIEFYLMGHEGAVSALAWVNNKVLASGGGDKTILLWGISASDTNTSIERQRTLKHISSVDVLAFIGKILAGGSKDSVFQWWNVDTGKRIGEEIYLYKLS